MTQKEIIDLFKRFLIVFVVGIPIICVLTFATKLPSGWVIAISILIIGAIFALEEYIRHKRIKKRQERREKYKKDKK